MKTIPAVLVVDDEMDHCLNLADILSEFDYRVDIAPDGATALEFLKHRAYDAALLDLRMPTMDGLSLFRSIRKTHPELPACFVTANPQCALADEVRACHAGPMLIKPLDIPRLLYWVARAVRHGEFSPN